MKQEKGRPIPFQDIPDNIKESPSVFGIKKQSKRWSKQTLLKEYMSIYDLGVKAYKKTPTDDEFMKNIQLENICLYYVLRKEFLHRMSPLVSKRSKKYIMKDNKELMDEFDKILFFGIDEKFNKAQEITLEIINRIG